MAARKLWLTVRSGVIIHPTAEISQTARFRPGRFGGIRVGARSQIAFNTFLFASDPITGRVSPIVVGRCCFVGGSSLIGPGVTVGDGSIIGAGSVVLQDVPPGCMVAGNPARVIREKIHALPYGRLARPRPDHDTR